MFVDGASIASLRLAMITSIPAARLFVCCVFRSSAKRSISGFEYGVSNNASWGKRQVPTTAASEK